MMIFLLVLAVLVTTIRLFQDFHVYKKSLLTGPDRKKEISMACHLFILAVLGFMLVKALV